EMAAVLAPEAKLLLFAGAPQALEKGPLGRHPAFLVHELDDAASDEFPELVTQHLGGALVREQRARLGVDQPNALVGRLDDLAVASVHLLERPLGAMPRDGDRREVRGPGDPSPLSI